MKTSTAGTAVSPTAPNVVRHSAIWRDRSERNPAITRIISTLPSSDGWNWKKPMSIQRRVPRVVVGEDEHAPRA